MLDSNKVSIFMLYPPKILGEYTSFAAPRKKVCNFYTYSRLYRFLRFLTFEHSQEINLNMCKRNIFNRVSFTITGLNEELR